MRRERSRPRDGWQGIVEAQGLLWHTDGDRLYWDETAYYAFTLAEIEQFETAVEDLYDLYSEAGERIAGDNRLLAQLGVPDFCHAAIRSEWDGVPPALDYGRFDLGYTGEGPPKLFEFNCDTPTALLEAAVVQWSWKEALFPALDQFTSLHERLIDRWKIIAPAFAGRRCWFAHIADASHEDTITTTYMRDLATEAGLDTHGVLMEQIGLDAQGRLLDGEDQVITALFKLYPWEWIVAEEFGEAVVANLPATLWIEPLWKMIWSNKAILPLLWEWFPDHPNLLPASMRAEDVGPSYVAKPVHAREGANIRLVRDGATLAETGGSYGDAAMVYQQLMPLRDFGGGYPVLGCWVVDGEPAGLGIREDGLITGNQARFVPHVIDG